MRADKQILKILLHGNILLTEMNQNIFHGLFAKNFGWAGVYKRIWLQLWTGEN